MDVSLAHNVCLSQDARGAKNLARNKQPAIERITTDQNAWFVTSGVVDQGGTRVDWGYDAKILPFDATDPSAMTTRVTVNRLHLPPSAEG